MILGVVIILLGFIILLKNLGLIIFPASFWSVIYPIILIVIGVYLILAAQKAKQMRDKVANKFFGDKKEE